MVNGVDAPNDVEARGWQPRRQQIPLKDLDIRASEAPCRIHMRRCEIDTNYISRGFDCIEQPGESLSRTASRIQYAHPWMQTQSGNEPTQLGLCE